MTQPPDSGKELLRSEFNRRVHEAVKLRDWAGLEHWAMQWISVDANHGAGFKWLARASVAQDKLKRAAYAYGRLLDFEPENEEAKKFFTDYPSTLDNQSPAVQKAAEKPSRPGAGLDPETLLTPDQRRLLANSELELGQHYERFLLHAEAAQRFRKSFDWHPSQAAALGAARALHRCNQGLEAMRFLREKITKFPDWIEGRMLLARISLDLGQRTEAQAEWQTVLRLDPNNREAVAFLRNLYSVTG